jgi:hypothetical protein
MPDWTGGATVSIYLKGFTISTLFDMKWGGSVHSMTYSWGRYAGTLSESLLGRETGIIGDGVKNIAPEGATPEYVKNDIVVDAKTFNQKSTGNTNTEHAVFDASYIKWRNLSVGYSLPAKAFKNTRIQDVSFGFTARNILILYKRAPHIDPETGFSDAASEQGQEFGQIAPARSYGFNFSIKF